MVMTVITGKVNRVYDFSSAVRRVRGEERRTKLSSSKMSVSKTSTIIFNLVITLVGSQVWSFCKFHFVECGFLWFFETPFFNPVIISGAASAMETVRAQITPSNRIFVSKFNDARWVPIIDFAK